MFAVRSWVLKELLSNSEWQEKLSKVKTLEEAGNIIREYCKYKGYKVKDIDYSK